MDHSSLARMLFKLAWSILGAQMTRPRKGPKRRI